MFGLLGSHLDLPEYIKMTVPCRLMQNLEVALPMRKCPYTKCLQSTCDKELIFK